MNKLIYLLFGCILLLLLLTTCARVGTPTGGAQDAFPPRAIHYSPDSAATGVKGKRIVIRFDEYITLNGINEQLIISPPLSVSPEITIRNKELIVDIRDTLRPNTTYTISFGNSIRDITENNILNNFCYVFSTGSSIDSLRIRGRVTNAITLNGEKDVLVMLYTTTADSVPYKQRPYYFAKTKDDGSYEITNLKVGTYKVIALDEKNGNYRYDGREERIGFRDSLLVVDRNRDSVQLVLFQEVISRQQILKASQPIPGKLSVILTQPTRRPFILLEPILSNETRQFLERNRTGDTLTLWLSKSSNDTVKLIVKDNDQALDTAQFQLIDPADKRIRFRGGQDGGRILRVASSLQPGQKAELYQPVQILTSIPISRFDTSGIILLQGKDTIRVTPQLDTLTRRIITLPLQLKSDSLYKLTVRPGSITDWFGQKSKDTVSISFTVRRADEYGNLSVKLPGLRAGNYLLQVYNEKGIRVAERNIVNGEEQLFDHLLSGQYSLHLIADRNANGRYDTGNYLEHQQPERIRIYGGAIKIRAGWDTDIEWKFKR